jgi:chromate reductase
VLGAVASPQMVAPEAYVQFTPDLIDDEGKVADPKTEEFLVKFMTAFKAYLDKQLA